MEDDGFSGLAADELMENDGDIGGGTGIAAADDDIVAIRSDGGGYGSDGEEETNSNGAKARKR